MHGVNEGSMHCFLYTKGTEIAEAAEKINAEKNGPRR